MKPVVDGFERDYAGRLVVIRLNIHEPVGKEIGEASGFQFTPTFIYYDAEGIEIWRTVGRLDEKLLIDSIKE